MKNIKTILVPTDFSASADYAVHYAFDLARVIDASIILYHSFIPIVSGFFPASQLKKENLEMEKNVLKRLDEIKKRLLRSRERVPISLKIDRGPEIKRIVEFTDRMKINLIVMGTKGASGLKEVLIGSVTADVMTNAPCPVLAIPRKLKFKAPKLITYSSDYHKKEVSAIKFLVNWNREFKTKISILHIDDVENTFKSAEKKFAAYRHRIEKLFKKVPLSFQHVAGKNISETILHITANDKTDILALSPVRRESLWNRLLQKSITKTTACHIRIPLLTIPIK